MHTFRAVLARSSQCCHPRPECGADVEHTSCANPQILLAAAVWPRAHQHLKCWQISTPAIVATSTQLALEGLWPRCQVGEYRSTQAKGSRTPFIPIIFENAGHTPNMAKHTRDIPPPFGMWMPPPFGTWPRVEGSTTPSQ
jgi:hypothetical protein